MAQQAIHQLVENRSLDLRTTKAVMNEIMDDQIVQAQISSFLTALRIKGETTDKITACATVMRDKAVKPNPPFSVMDIVGTRGNEVGTSSISTTSTSMAAARDIHTAKHGNHSVSSKSGAADMLECLGVKLALTTKQAGAVLRQTGMCFLFAPPYHSSMKYAAPARKEVGIRSIFNMLSPSSNSTGASVQLLGVHSKELVQPLAQVLANLGAKRDVMVYGDDGLDETTLTGAAHVCGVRFGELSPYDITPWELGLTTYRPEELIGGVPQENALITRGILSGSLREPKRNVVVTNAAISLYLGIDDCIIGGCVKKAQGIIDSGAAIGKMEGFIQATVRADLEGKKEMAS